MAANLRVNLESPICAEATALVEELDRDLLARYPRHNIHGVDLEKLEAGQGFFVVARLDGRPVGCGAVRVLEPGIGEVKRMYVRRVARRRGVAQAVLATLEKTAHAMGIHTLRLETGTRQPEANALYEKQGYHPIPCFGEYICDPFSLCYEKALCRKIVEAPADTIGTQVGRSL
jgi:GNAT superfamily N-acetyltransferase